MGSGCFIASARHLLEGMTDVLPIVTLTSQLLFSFGPVEATWRGYFFAARTAFAASIGFPSVT